MSVPAFGRAPAMRARPAQPDQLKYGTPEHSQFVKEVTEWETYIKGVLQQPWSDMVRWWKLYLADIEDTREQGEEWRAAVHVPYPYSGIETRAAALVDILNASDPPMQCGPVGGNDLKLARGAETLMGITLDMNQWRYRLDTLIRERCVQGTVLFRLAWRTEMARVNVAPTAHELAAYQSQMAKCALEAQKKGLPPPPGPDEIEEFMAWMEDLAEAGIPIPPNPYELAIPTRTFNGPKIERVSLFDARYDPTIETVQDQPIFILRSLWTADMLRRESGAGPDKMFDPAAIEEAIRAKSAGEDKRASDQDREIAEVLRVNKDTGAGGVDPLLRNAHEVWEVYRPGHKFPYTVLANPESGTAAGIVINKKQSEMPYAHGQIPVIAMKNVPVGGYFHGISELQQGERLYIELNSHRNLLLDAITLGVTPVFAKVNAYGMPIQQFNIRPGAVWDLPRADAIQAVTKTIPLADAWNLFSSLKADIDETNSTPSQLRGAPAQVGRVSATESERRFSQSLARIKQDAVRVEEELVPLAKQSLMLWYQFTTFEQRQSMGIPAVLTNDEILRSLDYDLRFRGATRSLNRDMLVQQMMTFANTFGALLPPHRNMTLARRIWEAMGLKSPDEIIPEADINTAEQKFNEQLAAPPPPPEGGGGPGGPPPPPEGNPPLTEAEAPPPPMPGDVEGAAPLPMPGDMV